MVGSKISRKGDSIGRYRNYYRNNGAFIRKHRLNVKVTRTQSVLKICPQLTMVINKTDIFVAKFLVLRQNISDGVGGVGAYSAFIFF